MRNTRQTALMVLAFSIAGCGDGSAQAQTNPLAQAQIRESLGDAPAVIDTTTAYRLSAAFRGAAERALPAVVRVSVTTAPVANQRRNPLEDLFPGQPGGRGQAPRGGRGMGSGFVFDERGYILTNNHVVENASRVLVTMVDGREYTATVVGNDPQTDVAVIKVDVPRGDRLQAVEMGVSDELHVGDWVIALGNPLGLQFTVTAGIVSAKGRSLGILSDSNEPGAGLESFIQTDAVINPGNSGGPMIDLTGKVVGINSAIESMTGVWAGNGFAIPIDLARKVASDIIEFGHVRRPRLGVGVGSINAADAEVYKLPSVAGAEITSVDPTLAAAKAGLEMGDVVVSLNGHSIRSSTEFMEELARQRPNDKVKLGIIRYGQRLEKTVELGEFGRRPASVQPVSAKPAAETLLGFGVAQLTPQDAAELGVRGGVYITEVDPLSSAAEVLGNGRGIVIRKINGRTINTPADVEAAVRSLKPGQTVTLVIRQGGQNFDSIINYRAR